MKNSIRPFLILPLFSSAASAIVHEVGPGFPMIHLKDVSWATLQPGDVVNIHGNPGGYHEKIQISASGTAAQHIVIHGVPDPVTGALPVIDGNGAVDDPNSSYRPGILSEFGIIIVSPRKDNYVYGSTHISFVDIENLDIRNASYTADASITFTDQFGAVHAYNTFACGIYVEWARDFTLRGCEINHCDNGFFANSKNETAQSSARLLIEGNHFHDNGLPYTVDPSNPNKVLSNGEHEHDCYIESEGVTYQYNRFGPMRPGCHGVAIKDRSSGIVIHYNEFDLGEQSAAIYLLQPQGGTGFIENQPNYQEAYVYGNSITIRDYDYPMRMLDWNSDNSAASYAALHRGTLHFFNNTLVNHHNRVALFGLTPSELTGPLPTYENIDCRNNIFFTDTEYMDAEYEKMVFFEPGTTNGGGDINLNGPNWISPGWAKSASGHPYGGALNGVENLIVGDAQGANDPGFVNMAAQDYHGLAGSRVIDAGGPLSSAAIALGHTDSLEYLAPRNFKPRVQLGAAMDLGAFERVADIVVGSGGNLSFVAPSYSAGESQGITGIDVVRSGGSLGSVSVDFIASDGTATANDYSVSPTTLTWQDGESGVKTVSVGITADSLVEGDETINLALTNVTGGALLLAPATSMLTIIDPPYQHWKLINFGASANDPLVAGDTVSATNDGIPNLVKYACGINPLVTSTEPLTTLDASHAFTFQHDPAATDVTLTVEVSTDLSDWKSGSQYSASLGDIPSNPWTTQLSRQLDPFTDLEQISVQNTPTAPLNSFIRLRASQP